MFPNSTKNVGYLRFGVTTHGGGGEGIISCTVVNFFGKACMLKRFPSVFDLQTCSSSHIDHDNLINLQLLVYLYAANHSQ